MTLDEAISVIMAQAEARAENTEEMYGRVDYNATDLEIRAMARDESERAVFYEIRDTWMAFKVIDEARKDGRLNNGTLDDLSVYDYFARRLGVPPQDETLRELPVKSECGADCRKAIDAAAQFKESTDKAASWISHSIIGACDETITIFWRG